MALQRSFHDPFQQTPAETRSAAGERGWHLSSRDLAEGLVVLEADDEEARSLFGELTVD